MTEILFGTPNSKTKGSLELLLKISTENPGYILFKRLTVEEPSTKILSVIKTEILLGILKIKVKKSWVNLETDLKSQTLFLN